MFMTTKGQIRLSYKREHTEINAAHLAYRTAVRNKILPRVRKQNDSVEQKNREGRPSGRIVSSKKKKTNIFDQLWHLMKSIAGFQPQSVRKMKQLAVLKCENPASFRLQEFPIFSSWWQDQRISWRTEIVFQFPETHNANSKSRAIFCT